MRLQCCVLHRAFLCDADLYVPSNVTQKFFLNGCSEAQRGLLLFGVRHARVCMHAFQLTNGTASSGPNVQRDDTKLRTGRQAASAMPAQHVKAPKQAQEDTSPTKIDVTSKPPVGDTPVVTLIRTDTTLDHGHTQQRQQQKSFSTGSKASAEGTAMSVSDLSAPERWVDDIELLVASCF